MPFFKKIKPLATAVFLSLFLSSVQAQENKDFNPKPASASLYNLGLKSFEQGDFTSSTSFFKRAIEIDPDFVDAYYNLGAIYKKQSNFKEAANAFQKAIDLNPKDSEVAYELANSYLELKDYEKAKRYYAAIPPDFPKYLEVKNKIELANQALTNPNTVNQGQLLVDTLSKPKEIESKSTNQNIAETNSTDQLLIDTLSMTTQETPSKKNILSNTTKSIKNVFKHDYKIVTSNFSGPTGIGKDSKGNVYIANFSKNNVERIFPNGSREVFIEQQGVVGPVGLAIDENDNLYIANYSGNSIVKINPNKEIQTVVEKIERPYYLYYDLVSRKLLITVQGNDSLVEVDINKLLGPQLTSN